MATLRINGRAHEVEVRPGDTLLRVLRDRLGLTGAKEACSRGECGACTVLLDGVPILPCVQLASLVRGEVTTIEGLADEARDHPRRRHERLGAPHRRVLTGWRAALASRIREWRLATRDRGFVTAGREGSAP